MTFFIAIVPLYGSNIIFDWFGFIFGFISLPLVFVSYGKSLKMTIKFY